MPSSFSLTADGNREEPAELLHLEPPARTGNPSLASPEPFPLMMSSQNGVTCHGGVSPPDTCGILYMLYVSLFPSSDPVGFIL